MSTKNLARTVIEGGRTGYYKTTVHDFQRQERTETRNFLRKTTVNNDNADAIVVPIRKRVYKEFADKTNPIYKFIDSRVGQNWNKVKSELFEKFDTRTTPGRHVIFDHLLDQVNEEGPKDVLGFHNTYYVDEQGHLQKNHIQQRKYRVEKFDKQALCAWLGNRCIGHVGKQYYWFEPTQNKSFKAYYDRNKLEYVVVDHTGKIVYDVIDYTNRIRYHFSPTLTVRLAGTRTFRQAKMLNDKELSYFESLPKHVRREVLAYAPIKTTQ